MPAAVSILTSVVTVQPGGDATAEVRIRNTGTIVDQFAFNLVGEAAAWAKCEPPSVSLFPDAEQTINVRFSPPRSSAVTAGTIHYGIRVTSQEDTGFSVVEEGTVNIGGFASVEAKVVPRTSEGKRKAVHRIEITNTGNSPVTADVSALDPDELLAFDVEPRTITVEPGATGIAKLKVSARKGNSTRGAKRLPFSVTVEPGGQPVEVHANFEQKPKGSSIFILLAILVAAGVLVFLLKDQASSLPLY
ncbi:MAG: hypothetical protein QOF60_1651 [Actinomycetota bacterium]|jgi:uncharacterized membrane protein|nr:hypothetical protein [Actinomycetota bacterium]